jgi:Icc-related predicted phosphoesterase
MFQWKIFIMARKIKEIMKIVAISDTHCQLKDILHKIPDGDILIHAGDFAGRGTQAEHWDFCNQFGSLPHKYKLVTPGNHDRWSETQTEACKKMFKEKNINLLIDEEINIDGVRIYMSPWTPTFGNWYWMRDRGKHIRRKWDNIPEGLDILVTHGPPYGILDVSVYDKIHVGCEELLKKVYEVKPKLHLFGHIHHWNGEHKENGTIFKNLSVCTEAYKPTQPITVIEYDV